MRKKSFLYLFLAIVWVYEITYLSLFEIEASSDPWLDIPHKDKIGHFGFYFGFTFLWNLYFKSIKIDVLKKIVVIAVIYGVLMEILQYLMPYGRMFDVIDIFANMSGAIAAYFFIKKVLPYLGALKRKN